MLKKMLGIGLVATVVAVITIAESPAEEGLLHKLRKKVAGTAGEEQAKNAPTPSPQATAVATTAADDVGDDTTGEAPSPFGNVSRAEVEKHLTEILDNNAELLNFIPELKRQSDPAGASFYTYKGARLETLDDKTLKNVLVRVQGEMNRLQTERLNKQLESIQQAQRAIMAVQQATRATQVVQPPPQPRIPQIQSVTMPPNVTVPPQPPRPSAVVMPPAVSQPPAQTPSGPPRIPSPPPAPPAGPPRR